MSVVERIKQGGSTITYIIVGLVLLAGLIGLICFVKQRGETARTNQATIAYEEQQKTSQKSEKNTKNNKKEEPVVVTNNKSVNNDEANVATNKKDLNLPQTGSEDPLLNACTIFILVSLITGYFLSRRRLAVSLT